MSAQLGLGIHPAWFIVGLVIWILLAVAVLIGIAIETRRMERERQERILRRIGEWTSQ